MTYTPDTPIAGPSRGSADAFSRWAAANGAARLPDVRLYLDTVYEWAPKAGLRAEVIVAQSIHETSDGRVGWASYWWKERCNPAGIGITGDPTQNAASRTFANGREAALAHIVHVFLYVKGKDLPAGLRPDMDPRWNAASGNAQIVGRKQTLGSFGSDGSVTTWAVDPQYGSKWAGWLNRLESVIAQGDTQSPAGDGTGGTDGRPDVAEQKAFVIAMGHRNTDRGGASNEINWTPGCARAIRDAIVARGGRAVIVQEQDSDGDPNWYPGGLQAMARRAVELTPKHGPFEAYISCHYNGGAGPGFHAIFPDAWSGVDQKVNNPLDVKLCENIVAAVRKTNTVSILSWTSHGPGVMSERESGVGAQGYRLGEFYGSIGFRDRTARVIIEAGSIDVARERNYINDDNWLRNVYAEAIVNGLEATFGTLGAAEQPKPDEPKPEVPKPVEYVKAVSIPALDKFLSGDVPAMPFSIPFEFEGTQWIGLPVNDTVRVKNPKGTPRYQTPGGEGRLNPDVSHNTEFELAFRMVKVGDSEAKWGRTRWGTWIDLADVEYVSD